MKFKELSLVAVFNIALMLTPAHAETTVFSHSFAGNNICEKIAGHWEGKGVVSKSVINCNYDGIGDIQSQGAGQFSMDISLKKTSGICPEGQQFHFTGSCVDGVVKLKTPDADIHGEVIDRNGNLFADNLKGQVWVEILKIRTAVDVAMTIHKTN